MFAKGTVKNERKGHRGIFELTSLAPFHNPSFVCNDMNSVTCPWQTRVHFDRTHNLRCNATAKKNDCKCFDSPKQGASNVGDYLSWSMVGIIEYRSMLLLPPPIVIPAEKETRYSLTPLSIVDKLLLLHLSSQSRLSKGWNAWTRESFCSLSCPMKIKRVVASPEFGGGFSPPQLSTSQNPPNLGGKKSR